MDPRREDSLVWRLPMFGGAGAPDNPEFDLPQAWAHALDAVARDLRCLRAGRDVNLDRLAWKFAVDDEYLVAIGWDGVRGLGGFMRRDGLMLDAGYDEAVVWVADTVQTELAGYEFVQWPSEGCHLFLTPH
ncbi:hypothetical protein G4H71_04665 [Rhodococcus triatomae]|uniref:Uncharacterized protein n=1 Tax=Rhodococcus triatomae TaxID=300028 RepID=A0A1G7ZXS6_9NOCA|nr:hypothetical protein [Rhodococcus triatomae]QNG17914.1 hypothetical protein G4H72_03380 [Rhodococcus triatomae]QNG22418.1 hypothetical protein G4H71_04665 [Rhodococcus triatomae]SDH13485.1 hypothetical protein SAMN05444695_101257 [Rhodococcus triatomae]